MPLQGEVVKFSITAMNHTMAIRTPFSSVLVFSIPELVSIIASHLHRSDVVRLARVCHHLFKTLIPTIWRYVNGSEALLRVIKYATFKSNGIKGQQYKVWYTRDTVAASLLSTSEFGRILDTQRAT